MLTERQFRETLVEYYNIHTAVKAEEEALKEKKRRLTALKEDILFHMQDTGMKKLKVGALSLERTNSLCMPSINLDTMKKAWQKEGVDVENLHAILQNYRKTNKNETTRLKVTTKK